MRGSQGSLQYTMFHNITFIGDDTLVYTTTLDVNSYIVVLTYYLAPYTTVQAPRRSVEKPVEHSTNLEVV